MEATSIFTPGPAFLVWMVLTFKDGMQPMSGYFTRNLGVTADFSGNYGTPFGRKLARLYTFMFGPTVRFPNSSRVTPLRMRCLAVDAPA